MSENTKVRKLKVGESRAEKSAVRKINAERTKADVARENGRKSKGPTSEEGKKRSSRNGIKHGLTANQNTLLSMESAEEYDEVYQAYVADLRPHTKAELRIVQRIANLDWRLERVVMMETCLQNIELAMKCDKILARFGSIDAIGLVVEAWKESCTNSSPLELLRRYQSSLTHQLGAAQKMFDKYETRRELRKLRGLDLDEHLYKVPEFDTLRDPKPTEVGDDIEEGDLYIEEPPAPKPAPLSIRSVDDLKKQGEPTNTGENKVPKRPAA